jgi:hypothetical protein
VEACAFGCWQFLLLRAISGLGRGGGESGVWGEWRSFLRGVPRRIRAGQSEGVGLLLPFLEAARKASTFFGAVVALCSEPQHWWCGAGLGDLLSAVCALLSILASGFSCPGDPMILFPLLSPCA